MLKREVHGIRMKVGVNIREFAGVTMRTLPPEGEEPGLKLDATRRRRRSQ